LGILLLVRVGRPLEACVKIGLGDLVVVIQELFGLSQCIAVVGSGRELVSVLGKW
jgi:hypothetical protein